MKWARLDLIHAALAACVSLLTMRIIVRIWQYERLTLKISDMAKITFCIKYAAHLSFYFSHCKHCHFDQARNVSRFWDITQRVPSRKLPCTRQIRQQAWLTRTLAVWLRPNCLTPPSPSYASPPLTLLIVRVSDNAAAEAQGTKGVWITFTRQAERDWMWWIPVNSWPNGYNKINHARRKKQLSTPRIAARPTRKIIYIVICPVWFILLRALIARSWQRNWTLKWVDSTQRN